MHRAKLQCRKGTHVETQACLPEEHFAGRVKSDPEGDVSEERSEEQQSDRGRGDVQAALDELGGSWKPHRRQPHEREALDGMEADPRAENLEESRHDVNLNFFVSQKTDDLQHALVRFLREGDDHTLDVEHRDDLRELLERPEDRELTEIGPCLLRIVIDEAHEVDPVLGMLSQLAGDQLSDVASTDDDGVLQVGEVAPAHGACRCSSGGDDHHRQGPKDGQLDRLRVRYAGEPRAGEHGPATERHHVEHTGELVHGRVVGPLLVSVVEPVDLRHQHPDRKREYEDERFDA